MRLNPPPIYALEEAPDGARGNLRELRTVAEPPSHGLRGAVVEEYLFHESPERRMLHDPHPLILGVSSPDVGLVVGLQGMILSAHRVATEFRRNRVGAPSQQGGDSSRAVSFRAIPLNLFPIRSPQVPPRATLFLSCFQFSPTKCPNSNGEMPCTSKRNSCE